MKYMNDLVKVLGRDGISMLYIAISNLSETVTLCDDIKYSLFLLSSFGIF